MPGQSTVSVDTGPGCPSDPSVDRFPIRVSMSPDRSNPIPLDGRLVGGTVHVFVDPANPALAATRIRQVEFRIDGGKLITEKVAPFDLARTTGSSARGLDTTLLTNGTHTVTAVVRLRNGTTQTLDGDVHRRQRGVGQVDPLLRLIGPRRRPTARRRHAHRTPDLHLRQPDHPGRRRHRSGSSATAG